jgi:Flp pilus assembly pilin Flp
MNLTSVSWRLLPAARTDRGAVAAEYVLLAALIAVVIIAAVVFLSGSLVGLFNETGSSFAEF